MGYPRYPVTREDLPLTSIGLPEVKFADFEIKDTKSFVEEFVNFPVTGLELMLNSTITSALVTI
jgi:hypothetical protein